MRLSASKTLAACAAVLAVVAMTAASCDDSSSGDAQSTGQTLTESTFKQQQAAVPYPAAQLRTSLERQNLKDRLLRLNKPSKVGYVYLMNFGKIVGYYVIRGKVSNTDSQLTTSTTILRDGSGASGGGNLAFAAPGDDGSYGVNETGNFFFTAEGVLVETDLNYLYADSPLPVNAPKLNASGPSK
jgi:hypothetical protein